MVLIFEPLVTAPVTRNVQGPMTATWHTPPPAPAAMPARMGSVPLASSDALMLSLEYLRGRHSATLKPRCRGFHAHENGALCGRLEELGI